MLALEQTGNIFETSVRALIVTSRKKRALVRSKHPSHAHNAYQKKIRFFLLSLLTPDTYLSIL